MEHSNLDNNGNHLYSEPVGNTDFRIKDDNQPNITYLYDKNGNLKGDYNKNIAWIEYNSLNLPKKIQMGNGNKTEYVYDGAGNKRKAKHSVVLNTMHIPLGATGTENTSNIKSTITRDYIDGIMYENSAIKRVEFQEGYFSTTSNPNFWKPVYQIKDYLGHVRTEIIKDEFILRNMGRLHRTDENYRG